MKEKNRLMNCFLVISVLIFIYLIFLLSNIEKITDYNFGSEDSYPSVEITRSVLIYIYPALCLYIISCIFFLIKKAKPRKVIYPIATIILVIFANIIGVIKNGGTFMWTIFFTFYPTIFIIVMSIVLGEKIDKKYEKME